jgi:hypothetical protein
MKNRDFELGAIVITMAILSDVAKSGHDRAIPRVDSIIHLTTTERHRVDT